MRSQALLSYLQDLALLVCTKARGGSLGGSGGALQRLLETRVVLEKLRPLEQRLKYQLEKLLRAAASGGRGSDDPLSFRPAPSNMAAQEEEEEEEEEAQGGVAKAPGLGGGRRYVPPRLVPVSCAPPERAQCQAQERARRRALSGSVLRELRQELGEGPLELLGEGPGTESPQEAHRRRWEESMLQRLSAPQWPRRRRGAGPGLDDVTNFGAFPALLGAANQEAPEPPRKKRKKPKPGKRKGRRGFRRRR